MSLFFYTKKMEEKNMRIGLIGLGAIGSFLLEKINRENVLPAYQITGVFDERKKKNHRLKEYQKNDDFRIYNDLDAFLASSVDLIIECANGEVVEKYAPAILQKKDLFVISVGALANKSLYEELQSITESSQRKLHLPTGAIGGLDVLQSAHILEGLASVRLTTRKPATALLDKEIEEEQVIFDGSAQEAIKEYPKNANIAITISLAGIGMEKTKVKIIADPSVTKNTHQLEAVGDFGTLQLTLENNPSKDNPKTSQLTALSILASLMKKDKWLMIG